MLSPDRTPPPHSQEAVNARACVGSACFSITALPEPGTLPRLIGTFAQRSMVPARWHGVLTPDGELQVDVQVDELAQEKAELVAAKLRAQIGVRTVLVFQKI